MSEKFTLCSVEACERNAHHSANGCRGFCQRHYSRFRKHGDPLAGNTAHHEPRRFIEEVVLKYSGNECLTWPYFRNASGYGHARFGSKGGIVSRYVCEREHGEPTTPKHQAAHSCGNGHLGCVTKSHLSWKTQSGNQLDRVIHDTHRRGERSPLAKLTEKQAREILALRGVTTQKEIAARFGVSAFTISQIHRGQRWSWLGENRSEAA